jgi:hypothetical protein
MSARVWVEVCGEGESHGPKGWPKRTHQYDENNPLPPPSETALNMTPDEFQKYCENMQAEYLEWLKVKKPDLAAKVESVPQAPVEVVGEPDTLESFEAEVIAPKKAHHHKKKKA